jgi:HK97 family phage prohead protease
VKQTITVDASALRARERMFSKHGARLGRDGPRFAKSNVAKVDDAEDEPRLCIEGIAALTEYAIANKNGTIIVFDPEAFDKHIASGRRTEMWIGHDSTKVVGSNNNGLELCLLNNGFAFRMPLTNRSYAATIKEMVASGKQAAISIGNTELKARDEICFGHAVRWIEEAEIREISLVPVGACKQAFARLIDANNEPPLNESVSSDMFTIEYGLHNVKVMKRDNDDAISSLASRLSALAAGMRCDDEPQSSAPSMTTNQSNARETSRVEKMQEQRRAKLFS